ncbi:hypothetical protein BP6252_00415 [Coleophoma cylindrospora]|uniref:DUF3500 domain-containing protein n=1 Tax=Coleophoma cylindrospora TaxID=1849047 RepID=A0A3D8SPY3_9HELO|nr:hypothetical protein BP6252_00415 [Coleophoma cylindrospora]
MEPTSTSTFKKASAGFRTHLPDLTSPRFTTAKTQDATSYAKFFNDNKAPPWLHALTQAWGKLFNEPYKGVTSDGTVIPGLYKIQDEGVPIEEIKAAVEKVLSKLNQTQKDKLQYPINAKEWRAWSNPEMLLRNFGIRLEDVPEDVTLAVLDVLKTTFSPEGYEKAIAAMEINHFLGEICEIPKIMNRYSYNFLLFGTPSATKSWGFSVYGHHLCLNVFLKGPQIIISPTFTGAEPNIIDEGPRMGTSILYPEGDLGLKLMQSLPKESQKKAVIFEQMHDPGMKQTGDLTVDRWNKDDQRHLCGAFRDNRIVPYEGVLVSDMTVEQKKLVLDIAEQFLLYHPAQARQKRIATIESHFNDTYFSWIGGYGDEDAFYYRVQSPVIIFEFDHHSGVFLTNTEPAKFHTHTIVRMPNAGDYGNALREEDEQVM